jgi:hypothetical protein
MKRVSLDSLRRANRPDGYVEDVLSHAAAVTKTHASLTNEAYHALKEKYQSGPGAELKRLLKSLGIEASPNCSCNKRAKLMDENEAKAPGWCEENIETISGWLAEESKKRGLPYIASAGKLLIRMAIRRAKRGNGSV